MARFEIYEFKNKTFPFVIDVQADLLSDLKTRIVIPLVPEKSSKEEAMPRLKPVIKVNNKHYIVMPTDIATVMLEDLGAMVCKLDNEQQQSITSALDFVFQGF